MLIPHWMALTGARLVTALLEAAGMTQQRLSGKRWTEWKMLTWVRVRQHRLTMIREMILCRHPIKDKVDNIN